MTWWEQVQQIYLDGLAGADRTLRADLEKAFDSGATTPAEQQRVIDQSIAAVEDPDARAELIAMYDKMRADLEADLRDSGYTGDLDSLSIAELARLAADRGLATVESDGVPSKSGLAAAAAADLATGSSEVDTESGSITIYDQLGNVHDYIPAGQKAPPASTIFDEIAAGSERGGPRPLPDQVDAAVKALLDQGWDPRNPGDAGVSLEPNGDVVATFPDGSTRTFEHDALDQALADLADARGNPADIAGVLDRTATGLGEGLVAGIGDLAGSWGRPAGGGATSPGGTSPGGTTGSTGTGSSGGSTTGGTTGATGASRGSNAPTSPDRTPMEDADPIWSTGDDKPASTGTKPAAEPAAEPAAAAPAAASNDGKNTFMTEEEQEAAAAAATGDGDGEDGWEDSTKKPPTDGTYVDADGDGNPDEDDDASTEDDDDDDDDDDESATAVGYTPRPGDEDIRTLTEAEVAALLAASPGGPNDGWSDGTNVKPTEFDPAYMVAAQRLKLGMIGQQGSPDIDTVPGAGPGLPDQAPGIDPDDDTPGHLPDGHDVGQEDPMQGHFQGTFDGSAGSGGDSGTGPTIAPQEMVVAEVNIDRPSVEGYGGMPALPGYGQTIGGSAAGSPDAPVDSTSPSAPDDLDPAAAASAADAVMPIQEMVEAEISVDLGSRSLPDYQYALGGSAGDAADRSPDDSDDDAGGRG